MWVSICLSGRGIVGDSDPGGWVAEVEAGLTVDAYHQPGKHRELCRATVEQLPRLAGRGLDDRGKRLGAARDDVAGNRAPLRDAAASVWATTASVAAPFCPAMVGVGMRDHSFDDQVPAFPAPVVRLVSVGNGQQWNTQ